MSKIGKKERLADIHHLGLTTIAAEAALPKEELVRSLATIVGIAALPIEEIEALPPLKPGEFVEDDRYPGAGD